MTEQKEKLSKEAEEYIQKTYIQILTNSGNLSSKSDEYKLTSEDWAKRANDWVRTKEINEQNWINYGIPPTPSIAQNNVLSVVPSIVIPKMNTVETEKEQEKSPERKRRIPNWIKAKQLKEKPEEKVLKNILDIIIKEAAEERIKNVDN